MKSKVIRFNLSPITSALVGCFLLLLPGCAMFESRLMLVPDDPALNDFAWMVGSWISREGDSSSEEHWTHPQAGTMFGVNRAIKGEKSVFFEFLRIENTPEGIVYLAQPKGRFPATVFKQVEPLTQDNCKAVFENLQHDYPQRITYWKTHDGRLHARTEGQQNGKPVSEEWTWNPATIGRK